MQHPLAQPAVERREVGLGVGPEPQQSVPAVREVHDRPITPGQIGVHRLGDLLHRRAQDLEGGREGAPGDLGMAALGVGVE